MKQKIFCKAESVTKTYLKIVANSLHDGKHAEDKLNQMLWSNNEHSMYYNYCHIGHAFTIG